MTQSDLLDVLAVSFPFVAVALLMALGISGGVLPQRVKDWAMRRVFQPLQWVLFAIGAALQIFKLTRKPDDLFAWMILALVALVSWLLLFGRKAASKTRPEMGTSE